ncbi:cell division control protein [Anaeramoeba ignava]|uniref:Cell division control protein n=1 Tax=Anaeramoeba ignava TaxID=1746090 RepID=A0A9Q0LJC7_ANAIG|nr:cell division control protein [Anaeramoeba ignava]
MSQEVQEFNTWIAAYKRQLDVENQFKDSINKIKSQFHYQRMKGLTKLLEYLYGLSENDIKTIEKIQNDDQYKVVNNVMKYIIEPKEPVLITHKPSEKKLGFEVIQGICLSHQESKKNFRESGGIDSVLGIIDSQPTLSFYGIEALMAALVDDPESQKYFAQKKGIDIVVRIMTDKKMQRNIRIRTTEFLRMLIENKEFKNKVQSLIGEKAVTYMESKVQFNDEMKKGSTMFINKLDTGF